MAVSKMMDLLNDPREVIRNDVSPATCGNSPEFTRPQELSRSFGSVFIGTERRGTV